MLLAAYATGLPLALAIVAIGFGTGVVALLFVIPVELEEVGEELAGSAIGAATAAGFVGGAISPLVGMALVAIDPILAFGFWTACFVAAAFLILAVRETGKARAPRVP